MSDVVSNRFEEDRKNSQSMVKRENWKGASDHSSGWQSSSEIRGDWNRGPSNLSPMKGLPFQNRRGNLNQPGTASRPHEFPSAQWNVPHSGPKGHSPPHRRSRWNSRSPEIRERISPEDGPDHRGFSRSKSPPHGPRSAHPRGSPVLNRRFPPRGSPDRGPLGSPAHGSRDLHGRGTRRSPDWGERNSPSQGCRRSPGPEGWSGRGSPSQFRRESPVQYGRDSPIRGSGGFPGPGTRGSPVEHCRGSPSRDSRGPRIPGARGSPIHRSRSPISGPSSSSGRVRRGSLGSPDRNVRGSPIPWNNSPSSMPRTRMGHHLTGIERSRSPRRGRWPSPARRSGSNRLPGEGMNRYNQQELPSHYDPSLDLPRNADSRGGFPYDREGNVDNNWLPEEFRDQSDHEINRQRFMRHRSNERIPRDLESTSNVDIVRPFVHDRLGPKLPDEDIILPYEGGPVVGAGSWEPPGDNVRVNQSPHGSSGGGSSCWERVPGSEPANPENELAPYEQHFTQALWDSNDPKGGKLEYRRSDPLLTKDNRRNDQERPPDKENRGNVWARVGGYVNDDNDPREGPRRSRDPHPSLDRHSPPRGVYGSSRRGMSREREEKFFRKSNRRSPGRRLSPPGRFEPHWESKRHAPYPERRRTPPKSGPRSHWKSPPRKRDWRSPPRRRGLRSPPRRW